MQGINGCYGGILETTLIQLLRVGMLTVDTFIGLQGSRFCLLSSPQMMHSHINKGFHNLLNGCLHEPLDSVTLMAASSPPTLLGPLLLVDQ